MHIHRCRENKETKMATKLSKGGKLSKKQSHLV